MYGVLMFAYPIGVQLFNRPDYSEKVLLSLKSQTLSVNEKTLFIFIDGFKGSIYESRGSADKTLEVAELARGLFPEATIHHFDANCGIADLHNKLQEAAFSGDDTWAAFFEEDLILEPTYLQELSDLIDIVDETEDVVKVACFQILPSMAHLPRGYDGFYPGVGTKAFAERKSFYLEKLPLLRYFVELQKRRDLPEVKVSKGDPYHRDSRRLSLIAPAFGQRLLCNYFEHDAITDAFIHASRRLHVVSKPSLAEDIGLEGVHDSFHIAPLFPSDLSSEEISPEKRRAAFYSSIQTMKNETADAILKMHIDILDGYFLSLSGKKMLSRAISLIITRIQPPIFRRRKF
jgi:hypothetical protein